MKTETSAPRQLAASRSQQWKARGETLHARLAAKYRPAVVRDLLDLAVLEHKARHAPARLTLMDAVRRGEIERRLGKRKNIVLGERGEFWAAEEFQMPEDEVGRGEPSTLNSQLSTFAIINYASRSARKAQHRYEKKSV